MHVSGTSMLITEDQVVTVRLIGFFLGGGCVKPYRHLYALCQITIIILITLSLVLISKQEVYHSICFIFCIILVCYVDDHCCVGRHGNDLCYDLLL